MRPSQSRGCKVAAMLNELAKQFSALERFGDECGDTVLQAIIADLVSEYIEALDQLDHASFVAE